MHWQYKFYAVSVLVAFVTASALAIYAWRHRQVRGAPAFMWFALLAVWHVFAEGLSMLSPTLDAARFWFDARFLTLAAIPVVWLIFTLHYTGLQRWLAPRYLIGLWIIPLITQLMVWTNPAHELWVRRHVSFFRAGPFLVADTGARIPGPWFWVHVTYSYGLILLGAFLIYRASHRALRLHREQTVALWLGMLLMAGGATVSTFEPLPGLDIPLTTPSFVPGILLFTWAGLHYRFLNIVPVARDRLIDSMGDGMLVLDLQHRILEYNPAMQELLDKVPTAGRKALPARLAGRPAAQVLPIWQDLAHRFQDETNLRTEIPISVQGERRHYDLQVSPLLDRGDQPVGRLLVLRDITRRRRTEQALREYAAELEATNAELDAFAHTVAHDLKNPVSRMIGFAEVMGEGFDDLSQDEIRDALHSIALAGRKTVNIVDELLLLASVRRAEQVELSQLDMGIIVSEALDRFRYELAESQAQVVCPSSTTWPPAIGYAPWVEEVWSNYISNALKYGGTPPLIELGACQSTTETPDPHADRHSSDGRKKVRFWVRDNGPGLDDQQQARLFTQFTRLHDLRARGHGLGLSIVQRIVERLGGDVGVESRPGEGSLFYFTLPAAGASSDATVLDAGSGFASTSTQRAGERMSSPPVKLRATLYPTSRNRRGLNNRSIRSITRF